jgi:outer membrane receptor protein involved in Fe transport
MLLLTTTTFAQQTYTIKGKVVDGTNETLPGAAVTCVNINKSTLTDENGNFIIAGIPANREVKLRITYAGFTTIEKTIDLSTGNVEGLTIVLKSDPLSLNEVVVTGVSTPGSKLTSSVSVSSITSADLLKSAPRTTAEIFRTIPGIRSEASGGDGNTNITVRGVPISSGGSKYLQLQEDGLPVLQFGDIAFATSDIFLRADQSVAKIEAIRGGSASTLATNSPAGIINFISKTGTTEGGSISTNFGLDYQNTRTDFDFGSSLGEGLTFHVGGFYRGGEGPRTAGYNANNGGQFKANLTKQFKNGYARVYMKYLNDRAIAYMPMPVQVSGTNADPKFESLAGFDAKNGAIHSPYLLQNLGLGVDGQLRRSDVTDGMNPVSSSVGAEFQFDLDNGWSVENRGRFSLNSGRFVSPFPAQVGTKASILSTIGTAMNTNLTGGSLKYAYNGATYNGSNAMIIHMFDTELNNFNNFVNDLKVRKSIGKADLTFGYFKSNQNINMSWLWNSYVLDVNGDEAKPLNVFTAGGANISQNGLFAYGVPVWGNLHRSYNAKYDISAPYMALSLPVNDQLNVDASFRYDFGKVRGSYAGNTQTRFDVNNDGVISPTEQSVSAIDLANAKPINYNYDYASYSIGANYLIDDAKAVFGRYSKGAAAKADRILFSPNVLADGNAFGAVDKIDQAELGFKYKYNKGGLFITGFYASTNEAGGFEATTQKIIENDYKSYGLELEAVANLAKNFDVRGSLTLTKAEISSGANKGNTPRRQADVIFSLIPSYTINKFATGISIIGTTKSYAQDNNKLVLPGYTIVSPYINYNISKRLTAAINANNILNSFGFTESEEDSITENQVNIIRARSITGRTIGGSLTFSF